MKLYNAVFFVNTKTGRVSHSALIMIRKNGDIYTVKSDLFKPLHDISNKSSTIIAADPVDAARQYLNKSVSNYCSGVDHVYIQPVNF